MDPIQRLLLLLISAILVFIAVTLALILTGEIILVYVREEGG